MHNDRRMRLWNYDPQAVGHPDLTTPLFNLPQPPPSPASVMVDITSLTQVWSALRFLHSMDGQDRLGQARDALIRRAREAYSGWEPLASTLAHSLWPS